MPAAPITETETQTPTGEEKNPAMEYGILAVGLLISLFIIKYYLSSEYFLKSFLIRSRTKCPGCLTSCIKRAVNAKFSVVGGLDVKFTGDKGIELNITNGKLNHGPVVVTVNSMTIVAEHICSLGQQQFKTASFVGNANVNKVTNEQMNKDLGGYALYHDNYFSGAAQDALTWFAGGLMTNQVKKGIVDAIGSNFQDPGAINVQAQSSQYHITSPQLNLKQQIDKHPYRFEGGITFFQGTWFDSTHTNANVGINVTAHGSESKDHDEKTIHIKAIVLGVIVFLIPIAVVIAWQVFLRKKETDLS